MFLLYVGETAVINTHILNKHLLQLTNSFSPRAVCIAITDPCRNSILRGIVLSLQPSCYHLNLALINAPCSILSSVVTTYSIEWTEQHRSNYCAERHCVFVLFVVITKEEVEPISLKVLALKSAQWNQALIKMGRSLVDFGSIAMVLWTTHVYLSQLLTNTGTILSRCTLQQPIVLSHSIKCVVFTVGCYCALQSVLQKSK